VVETKVEVKPLELNPQPLNSLKKVSDMRTIIGKVNFVGFDCVVVKTQYVENDRIALVLEDVNDGATVATATVNIPNVDLAPDEVLIKNYSENDGMLNTLINAGIVEKSDRKVCNGFVTIPICKLLF